MAVTISSDKITFPENPQPYPQYVVAITTMTHDDRKTNVNKSASLGNVQLEKKCLQLIFHVNLQLINGILYTQHNAPQKDT